MTFWTLPLPIKYYVGLLSLAGFLILCSTVYAAAPALEVGSVVMILLGGIAGLWQVDLGVRQGKMTLGSIIVVLALLIYGDKVAVLASALSAVFGSTMKLDAKHRRIRLRLNDFRMLFNAGVCALSTAIGAAAYDLSREWSRGHGHDPLVVMGIGVTAFQTVYFLLNTTCVAYVVARLSDRRPYPVWREHFLWTGASYYAAGSFGLIIYLLYSSDVTHAWAILVVPPAWFIYYFYRLHSEKVRLLQEKAEQASRHILDLENLNTAILTSLSRAIDAKDRYTRSHISRVQLYAVSLAEAAGLTGDELKAVQTGALVHDIGKIGIPERILGKPDRLTPDEFARIQTHVTIGAEILAPVPFPYPVIPIVLSHHERWDGLGYPLGLKGEDIPIGGRIMAIADVFDALTSNRPYRPAMPADAALEALRQGAGRHFDPSLIEIFSRILPDVRVRIHELEGAAPATSDTGTGTGGNWALSQIRISAAEMSAASDLPRILADCAGEEAVLKAVIDCVLTRLPVNACVIYLSDPETGALDARAAGGLHADRLSGLIIGRGEGVAGWVAETRKPQVNAQASTDIARRFNPTETIELSAVTAVPLVSAGASLGVISFYTTGYSVLREDHLGLLNVFAEHTSAALVSARRFERTREMSLTDPLTGLPNSRSLIFQMEELCADLPGSSNGGPRSFLVMMLDLDGFKAVNEAHGHLRGDEVLCEIAEMMRRHLRPSDHLTRYAGDEFVIILRDGDPRAADAFVQTFRRELEQTAGNWVEQGMSVSTGVAAYPVDGATVRALLAVADERMYADKFERRAGASRPGRARARDAASAARRSSARGAIVAEREVPAEAKGPDNSNHVG